MISTGCRSCCHGGSVNRLSAVVAMLVLMCMGGTAIAGTWVFTGSGSSSVCDKSCPVYDGDDYTFWAEGGSTYNISTSISASFNNAGCSWCNSSYASLGTRTQAHAGNCYAYVDSSSWGGGSSSSTVYTPSSDVNFAPYVRYVRGDDWCCEGSCSGTIIISNETSYYTASGSTSCVNETALYLYSGGSHHYVDHTTGASYSFDIYDGLSYRLLFDGAFYDFTCDAADEVFDYDACIWVYGYTCGVDNIKLYKDDSGWILDDSVGQSTGYDVYEMAIVAGEDYKISFIDSDTVVHNQTFSCTGDHVLIDFDRCNWVYPPSPYAPPYIIYTWAGYDYNIVVFKDEHGNFIENSQLAIYDMTSGNYIQKWTPTNDGYALLGARFDTDHDVLLSLKTFDGIFNMETTYPANGSAPVGEEIITTTNWTVPIRYNVDIFPVDVGGMPILDVFCGLSEYTPLNPGAFWGMDLSDQGVISVSSCSGFAMCDIMAEKAGYTNYITTALNWTSKSALTKDYRHNIIMEEE